jgi:hypothetical protein
MVIDQPHEPPPLPATHVACIERFFRVVAGLELDQDDMRRYDAFLDAKLTDLLIRGAEVAKATSRRIVVPSDLPITKGLSACIDEFLLLDEKLDPLPILNRLAKKPVLAGAEYHRHTLAQLPHIQGGMSIALARNFRVIEPRAARVSTGQWDRTFNLFDLVW